MGQYSVNDYSVDHILGWIKSGEIAIPEIQRPFVWRATQVRDLLDSLYQGYPIGYIIVWKNPNVRLKDGSSSQGKKVIIDGQQRITALSAALLGQKVINANYEQVNIRIAFNPHEQRFEVSNPAIAQDKNWISDIAPLLRGEITLLRFVREYRASNQKVDEEHLEKITTQLIRIKDRPIGMIDLNADLDVEVVTEIFTRINRQGVSLSQADFVMSKIAANEIYRGNELRKTIDYFCHLARAPEFYRHIEDNDKDFAGSDYFKTMRWLRNEKNDLYDPDYSDMLRVAFTAQFSRGKLADLVGLLSGRNFKTRSYEDEIAKESFEKLSQGVISFMAETNFQRFLMIIHSAGFIDKRLVGSYGPLNFSYALFLRLRFKEYPPNDIETFVRRWFVLSLLTGRYSGSPETRFDQDIQKIDQGSFGEYLGRIEDAELSDAFWEVGLVQELITSSKNSPAFKTFIAAQIKNNARGFLSRDITVKSMIEQRGDAHHIFPRAYLRDELKLNHHTQYNQVANYTYMQQEINIKISDRPPRQYIGQVKTQCTTKEPVYGGITDVDDLCRNLRENAIPAELLDGDIGYADFIEARRKLMAGAIRDYYRAL